MPKHLISRERTPEGLIEEYWHDPAAGTITIRRWADAEPFWRTNQMEFNGYSSKGRHNFNEGIGRKVASVSPADYLELKKRGYDTLTMSDAELRKLFNDREFRYLRTAPGRL
jgi:hypothetical protein